MVETDSSHRCGIGIRGVSMFIDSVVWFAFFFVAIFAVAGATGQIETTVDGANADLEGGLGAVALLLWLALGIGYHTILEWRYGKTAGKYLVSIRVVDEDGSLPSLQSSLIRNVTRLVDWLPVLYLVGIVAIAISDKQRRLGDRLAGTVVVR
jgi:uncharacterized RDD family membrane protein YckC